ncbi:MAG: hypothetical protein IJO21_03325 [Oscillospiraceae bacterium]|nr:hypothetical protein [Oscillospiraceae bacterium]
MRGGNSPQTGFGLRLMAAGIVLYWYYELVVLYVRGGPDAPSLTAVILAGILMVGGAIFVGITAWQIYKKEKAALEEAKAQDKEEESNEDPQD